MSRALFGLILLLTAWSGSAKPLELVRRGKAAAVIVTGETPSVIVRFAVEELNWHIKQATGQELLVAGENVVPRKPPRRIYLGDCKAARAAGIDAAALPFDGYVVKTTENEAYIVGNDSPTGDALSLKTSVGTLFGVYRVLEMAAGVRWLWPGELGAFVPQSQTLAVDAGLDLKVEPKLALRKVRTDVSLWRERPASAMHKQYQRDLAIFLRRHRMGGQATLRYGHSFNWWRRQGKEHPEWFQLVDGKRGQVDRWPPSMCVSNPGFQQQVLDNWKKQWTKNKDKVCLSAGENDTPGRCTCAFCRAMDGPQDRWHPPLVGGERIVSDRYAKLWALLYQRAAAIEPRVKLTGYAYTNYLPAPSPEIKLNSNISIGFVPDILFPRSDRDHEWVKQQWGGWRASGVTLFLRPNYFHDGYCMPHIFAHQFAEEFRFQFANGMVGFDFDSLTGQWATQGPNLYLLMRLHRSPGVDTDTVLAEYYAGFGRAAVLVKAYFDYWEAYARASHRKDPAMWRERSSFGWQYFRMAHKAFPPDAFGPAANMLAAAARVTPAESSAAARVAFLRKGLAHAKLCVELAALASDRESAAFKAAQQELLDFRARTGGYIANFNHCAWIERPRRKRE